MNKQKLRNRTTLITGASSGIGRAAALLFASHGSDLLLLSRDGEKLGALRSIVEKTHGVRCTLLQQDIRQTEDLRDKLSEVLRKLPPDYAIINAGIGQYGPVSDSPWADLEDVLNTNINGTLAAAHAVVPFLIGRPHTSIVFISSVLGKRSMPYNAAYCASKFALQGFAEALRLELKPRGVHVGVVCPARTDTEFFERMKYSVRQSKQRNVPTGTAEHVADVILRTVLRRKREAIVSPGGKLFSFAGYHFPRLTDYIFSRAVPKPAAVPVTNGDSHES